MKLTRELIESMAKVYEKEYNVNPLKKRRWKEVVLSRQSIISILKKRFSLTEAHLSKLFECDRATIYHSVYTVEEQIKLRSTVYVQSIERWIPIIKEFEEQMKSVSVSVSVNTTEEVILRLLSKHTAKECSEILSNITNNIA